MILQINIPDPLYRKYQLLHATKSEDEVKALLKDRLLKWLDVLVFANPADRTILLGGDDRRKIEAVFQTTVNDPQDLINKIKALSSVQVGSLIFNLSPSESIRLSEQAKFHGWPTQQFFDNTCREIVDRFMERF